VDARRSFYLAVLRDELGELSTPASDLNWNDIPYIAAANDNLQLKEGVLARCEALLRRLLYR
jgi:hypothetical protein